MLFVADSIPSELRRVVEFLNEQMDPAEVLALELRQYEGESGLKSLVPRLYGQTEEAQQRKAPTSEKRQSDEDSFYEEIRKGLGPELVDVARQIANWMWANCEFNMVRERKDTWIDRYNIQLWQCPTLSLERLH